MPITKEAKKEYDRISYIEYKQKLLKKLYQADPEKYKARQQKSINIHRDKRNARRRELYKQKNLLKNN